MATPSSNNEVALRDRPAIAVYLAGWAVGFCGVYVGGLVMNYDQYTHLQLALLTAGVVFSYLLRRSSHSSRTHEMITGSVLIIMASVLFVGPQIVPSVFSAFSGGSIASALSSSPYGGYHPYIQDYGGTTLIFVMGWLTVVWSFAMLSDALVLFEPVFVLAIFGLAAGVVAVDSLIPVFLLFLTSSAFIMVYDTTASDFEGGANLPLNNLSWTAIAHYLGLTIACVLISYMIALRIAGPLQDTGAAFGFTARIPGPPLPSALSSSSTDSTQITTDNLKVASGPVTLSNTVLMRVACPRPLYWRVRTYDYYTGHGWEDRLSSETHSYYAPGSFYFNIYRSHNPPPTPFVFHLQKPSAMKYRQLIRQTFTLVSGVYDYFIAADQPVTISAPVVSLTTSLDGMIQPGRQLIAGNSYSVVSEVPLADPKVLSQSATDYPYPISALYFQTYPRGGSFQTDVLQLAQKWTADARTPYQKVVALARHIADRCRYNTATPATPSNRDVVSEFLFKRREGYCDVFATALAIMCRMVGVPARVASGFIADPDGSSPGNYIIRARDSHLWTEVYFTGVGWVPFDATEGAINISPKSTSRHLAVQSLWKRLISHGWKPLAALAAIACLLLYVLSTEILTRIKRKKAFNAVAPAIPITNWQICQYYHAVEKVFARYGYRRSRSETIHEYNERLRHRIFKGELIEELDRLTELTMIARYGRSVMDGQTVKEAAQRYSRIRYLSRRIPRASKEKVSAI